MIRAARRAFTLVEVMMAVLILALLSSAAALSFSSTVTTARFRDALQAVERFDGAARIAATSTGKPVRLVFDRSTNAVVRREGPGLSQVTAKLGLPSGVRIDEIRIDGRTMNEGDVTLDISPLGMSRTYALKFIGKGESRWLLFAGLSGQATQVSSTERMDAIDRDSHTAAPRLDAH